MKYLISLILGLVCGATLLLAVLYFNPFVARQALSPLAVSDNVMVVVNYSLVPADSLLFTNDGESVRKPFPLKVQELWEPAVQKTWVTVAELTSVRGEVVGVGIKFASDSEKSRPLRGEALVDSVWHIYLPGRGTLLVQQVENYWSLLTDIVVPARWSSSDSWRGSWHNSITVGPAALGTGKVIGQTGEFAGLSAEAMESVDATVYSALDGPVKMHGSLTIARPTENPAQ
jgi:hypothetical protein